MSHAGYFRLLKVYADLWARRHCRVILSGEENLEPRTGRPRIYVISHPVTWDLPMLAHMGRNNFYVIVDKGPFAHPLVSWLFNNAGFLKLEGGNADDVITRATTIVQARQPLIISLYGYGVDFGEKVRPRSGGIRIAHAAQADIYPIHLTIEEGARIMKAFKNHRGDSFPFSVFHDALYFATFLPPLRYENWASDGMTYEDYTRVAFELEESFMESEKTVTAALQVGRWDGVRHRGGLDRPVTY